MGKTVARNTGPWTPTVVRNMRPRTPTVDSSDFTFTPDMASSPISLVDMTEDEEPVEDGTSISVTLARLPSSVSVTRMDQTVTRERRLLHKIEAASELLNTAGHKVERAIREGEVGNRT